jgi:DNA-binding LacI/PurR family transcriptional regulator
LILDKTLERFYNATGCINEHVDVNKMTEKPVQTIADIARICCVSKSTVSRALNDSALISAETKERIRLVAKENNFQINNPARCLSLQHSRTIAFVVNAHHTQDCFSLADLFLLEILGAISSTLATHHYDLLVANVDPHDPDWPHQYLDTGRVDGFILLTSTRKQYHINTLVEMEAPFIVWNNVCLPDGSYCSVTNDNFSGGKLAAGHLLEKGRRRIGFVGGPENEYESQQRYEGYAAALQENGLAVDPALVTYGEWTSESAVGQMQQLLETAPDLDAVFANSDLMAAAAINVLHEHGRRVPQDVAVVGYDDLSIAKFNSPPLTTISQNLPLVGKLLAQNLIQNIETGQVTSVTLPAELVVRQST